MLVGADGELLTPESLLTPGEEFEAGREEGMGFIVMHW